MSKEPGSARLPPSACAWRQGRYRPRSGTRVEQTRDSSITATPAESAEPNPDVPDVPDVLAFEAPLLGGGTFVGSQLAGKDVAFWFWAPW